MESSSSSGRLTSLIAAILTLKKHYFKPHPLFQITLTSKINQKAESPPTGPGSLF
jgi:hypothetical protein